MKRYVCSSADGQGRHTNALRAAPTMAGAAHRVRRQRISFFIWGFAPRPPTRSLAGTPRSPLRARGSLAALVRSALDLGASPPDPLHARSRGPHDPRSARVAHSLRSFAQLLISGLRPQTPLHARSRGPHDPRSARVAHSLRSFAQLLIRGFAPRPPTRSLAGTPRSPLRLVRRSCAAAKVHRVAHSLRSFALLGAAADSAVLDRSRGGGSSEGR